MALELRHLRYLIAVAEHGSFTRAAEELRISQPTLSQQIRQLERTVGAQLLDRTGRTVRLTDAGATYAHYARGALRDLAAAERAVTDLADLSRGHLRLALTPTFTAYLVGPLTAGLHAAHPGITVEVREMPQDRIEAGLLADDHDLGLAFDRPHLPGIAAAPLFTETLGLVVAADGAGDHPPAGEALSVRDLAERRLALLSGDFATRGHVDAYLRAHGVRPHVAVEANSVQALTEIVRRTPWPPSCRTPSPTTTRTCARCRWTRPSRHGPSSCCAGRARTRARRRAPSPDSSGAWSAPADTARPKRGLSGLDRRPGQALDAGQELPGVEGLREAVVHTGLQRAGRALRVRGRQREDRHPPVTGGAADLLEQRDLVQPRPPSLSSRATVSAPVPPSTTAKPRPRGGAPAASGAYGPSPREGSCPGKRCSWWPFSIRCRPVTEPTS